MEGGASHAVYVIDTLRDTIIFEPANILACCGVTNVLLNLETICFCWVFGGMLSGCHNNM